MGASKRWIMAGTSIRIPLKSAELEGELCLPVNRVGLVLFAHGSGSSRHSPRNQFVARILNEAGLGTLLFDLLTAEEESAEAVTRHLRFDIKVLSERLIAASRWSMSRAATLDLPMGYFGSSTGAAAAIVAASELGNDISAVVSRGGRPDLAKAALDRIAAPTLLIVGGDDYPVLTLNQEACDRLGCEKALRIIPGATHLFEEPGKLEQAARFACEWFVRHLQLFA